MCLFILVQTIGSFTVRGENRLFAFKHTPGFVPPANINVGQGNSDYLVYFPELFCYT